MITASSGLSSHAQCGPQRTITLPFLARTSPGSSVICIGKLVLRRHAVVRICLTSEERFEGGLVITSPTGVLRR